MHSQRNRKNDKSAPTEYALKGKRPFWIDRVVPILQKLGDQTGFLGFEWCETVADERLEPTIVPESWVNGNVWYLDGLGYDKKGRSKIVMESSSKPAAEKIGHTLNDTIKNMHNSIALLEAVVRRNQYARFSTISKVRPFSLHWYVKHRPCQVLAWIPLPLANTLFNSTATPSCQCSLANHSCGIKCLSFLLC